MSKVLHRLTVSIPHHHYPLVIGQGVLQENLTLLNLTARRFLLVSDDVVYPLYGQALSQTLPQVTPFIIPSGESSKSWENIMFLVDGFLDQRIDRDTMVIALGGGVVGDLAGFAASITLRGIPIVHIPTTLLSQVDSAIGGKTAINTRFGKNLVGTFYQPSGVIMDIDVLKTLSDDQMLAGYGEILKYALLGDASFFMFLQDHGADVLNRDVRALSHAMAVSCQMKATIVSGDEKEHGARALLNLGHTFGHAIEQVSGFTVLHGHAVLMGLRLAADLSHRLGFLALSEASAIHHHIASLPLSIPMSSFSVTDLIEAMAFDKKNKNDVITFVLLSCIGQAFRYHQPVPKNLLAQVWAAAGAAL